MSLLAVKNLSVSIGAETLVDAVSFTLGAGEVLGVVGESGSGKSLTALGIMGLLPHGARVSGDITLEGRSLTGLGERAMNSVRGGQIGMVFQEPMTALNPVMTIGDQVAEAAALHAGTGRAAARARAAAALEKVGLSAGDVGYDRYPHQLSGGQRQRVGIAMATVRGPNLLIADEPTTALDVTTQTRILDLLGGLVRDEGMGMILITHDLAVVAGLADRLVILEAGRVVEAGATASVLAAPRAPYTRQLLRASTHAPQRRPAVERIRNGPLLEVEAVAKRYFPAGGLFARRHAVDALRGVSFSVAPGESVGLVGESGSGKSTLARAILGLERPDSGRIRLAGAPVDGPGGTAFATRRAMQIVFQDPYGSFDPRQKVARLVAEPFHLLGDKAPRGAERRRAVDEALEAVGLGARDAEKFIHEFSGGQRQRIAIARALIVRPSLVVLDEPVSALDVTVRAQILDLLADLADRYGLAYLFVAHDLGVVRAVTDRVLVMRDGEIVEEGETAQLFAHPRHDYTRTLLAATPSLEIAKDRQRRPD